MSPRPLVAFYGHHKCASTWIHSVLDAVAADAGWRLAVEPRALAHHVKGASDRGHRAELEYRRSQLLYYAKHRPSWEQRFLRRRLERGFREVADVESFTVGSARPEAD